MTVSENCEARRMMWAGRRGRTTRLARVTVLAIASLMTIALTSCGTDSAIRFTDVEEQSRDFLAYYEGIELTAEQEQVKRQALSAIPAPCCSDKSAYTCCCPCNMAKTWWGLAHHLIAERGYGVEQVEAAVRNWIEFIGPGGFTGNACYTGGCIRPFRHNGCGGMTDDQLTF